MDPQTQSQNFIQSDQTSGPSQDNFEPGSTLIYPMHGKCTLLAIEDRQISGQKISFYKLEPLRSSFSRSTRREPAIWVPTHSARERGLRPPISTGQLQTVMDTLASREYYFDINESWESLSHKMEQATRAEGAVGLAKALSCIHVIRRRQAVASPEVNRAYESTQKALLREISDLTGEGMRDIEARISKLLRNKLIPSN